MHFCPEPIAAAYDFRSRLTEPKVVLVADFGGGTSDYTVARLTPDEDDVEVLALGGVSVAGDAFDGSIMRHKVSAHFGANVKYKVPFGSNVLSMPRPLMESLCSPAETCLLAHRDIMAFLRDIKSGSLGKDDKQHIDQLLCLVEDSLGFQMFEVIEHAKRELSDNEVDPAASSTIPASTSPKPITRSEFQSFSAPQVDSYLGLPRSHLGRERLGRDRHRFGVLHRRHRARGGVLAEAASRAVLAPKSWCGCAACTRSFRVWANARGVWPDRGRDALD